MIEAVLDVVVRTVSTLGPAPTLLLRHGGVGLRDTDQAIVLDTDGHAAAVVKVARGARGRELLRAEHDRLARLAATLLPSRPFATPRPLGFHETSGRAFLVETFLSGRKMRDMDPAYVERRGDLLDDVVDWLVDFSRAERVEEAPLEDGAIEAEVAAAANRYMTLFDTSPEERVLLGSFPERLRDAFGASAPIVAVHGDFCDANVMVGDDGIGVLDWEEPAPRSLPGADLFHFLLSTAVTRHGFDDPDRFRTAFVESFFAPTPAATRNRRAVERYRNALGIPRPALFPLFATAWIRLALHKLDYLAESGSQADPNSSYPILAFYGRRCLNVSLTSHLASSFQLT